jgi:hypothetical protein
MSDELDLRPSADQCPLVSTSEPKGRSPTLSCPSSSDTRRSGATTPTSGPMHSTAIVEEVHVLVWKADADGCAPVVNGTARPSGRRLTLWVGVRCCVGS